MLRLLYLFVISVLFIPSSYSSSHIIKAKVKGLPVQRVYLSLLRGEDILTKDSVLSTEGKFSFSLSEQAEPGIYRISFGRKPGDESIESLFLDIIFNGEDIEFSTAWSDPEGQMKVLKSKENIQYYKFINLHRESQVKFNRLMDLLEVYQPENTFYKSLSKEIVRVRENFTDSLLLLMSEEPLSLASSVISVYREPVWDPETGISYRKFMQDHFLDHVSFDDPRLINSRVYNRKIISYLGLFRDPLKSQEDSGQDYIKAVDVIMEKSSYNQEVYDFVMNYLIDGFTQLNMEDVLVHIADNYLEGECETDSKKIMEERLKAYQRMAPGKKVDDIALLDLFDTPQRLSDSPDDDYTLLIFWASWCPHCQNLLPRLKKWFSDVDPDKPQVSLYAVSIDSSRVDWEEFVLSNDLPGTHVLEPGGWEGNYAREFNVYATPTMFLLDKDRKIVAKPVTYREFKRAVGKLE